MLSSQHGPAPSLWLQVWPWAAAGQEQLLWGWAGCLPQQTWRRRQNLPARSDSSQPCAAGSVCAKAEPSQGACGHHHSHWPPGQRASEGRGGHCTVLQCVPVWAAGPPKPKLVLLSAASNSPSTQGCRTQVQTSAKNDKVPPTAREGCGTPHQKLFRRLQLMSLTSASHPAQLRRAQGIRVWPLTCHTRTHIDPTLHCSPKPLAKVTVSAPTSEMEHRDTD